MRVSIILLVSFLAISSTLVLRTTRSMPLTPVGSKSGISQRASSLSLAGVSPLESQTWKNPYYRVSRIGQFVYLPLRWLSGSSYGILLALLTTFRATNVLGNAYERDRLDASTFRWLNLGVASGSALCVIHNIMLRRLYAIDMLAILLLSAGSTAIRNMQKFGWPSLSKLKWRGEKGSCPFTAFLYVLAGITNLTNIFWTITSMPRRFIPGELFLQMTIFPSAYLALSQAAVGGRLQSATYKQLNYVLFSSTLIDAVKSGFCFPLMMGSSLTATALGIQNGIYAANKKK